MKPPREIKDNGSFLPAGGEGDLFTPAPVPGEGVPPEGPLADRMRPAELEEFVGQAELMGEGAVLRRMIEEDRLSSVIFWGPPGSGKTSLARLLARRTGASFLAYSAVTSGAKEMREVMTRAAELRRRTGRRTILFVDEVHRFNRAQQDAFLPFVEKGDIVLVGATTENPSFEVNAALLSRSKVFIFQPLLPEEVSFLLSRAVERDGRLRALGLTVEEDALSALVAFADGDARRAFNALELAAGMAEPGPGGERILTAAVVARALQRKAVAHDRDREEHYNIISALHKSLRGSDPDAALYWLARLLEGGEDRRFVLRRLTRFAAEDVGLADPNALVRAAAAWDAFDRLGIPEGDLALAQLAVDLALSPKSNAVYLAWGQATRDVRDQPLRPVPLHIRNAPTRLMREAGYGEGYEYSHDFAEALSPQSFFPEGMGERRYYRPGPRGREKELGERLERMRETVRRLRAEKAKGEGGEGR